MKKLIAALLLLTAFSAHSQTTPVTPSFRINTPVNSKDSLAYTYPFKIGGYSWLYNGEYIRTNYYKKSQVNSGFIQNNDSSPQTASSWITGAHIVGLDYPYNYTSMSETLFKAVSTSGESFMRSYGFGFGNNGVDFSGNANDGTGQVEFNGSSPVLFKQALRADLAPSNAKDVVRLTDVQSGYIPYSNSISNATMGPYSFNAATIRANYPNLSINSGGVVGTDIAAVAPLGGVSHIGFAQDSSNVAKSTYDWVQGSEARSGQWTGNNLYFRGIDNTGDPNSYDNIWSIERATRNTTFYHNVGIGVTPSTTTKLTVGNQAVAQPTSSDVVAVFSNTANSGTRIMIDNIGTGVGVNPAFVFRKSRGSESAPSAVLTGDAIAAISAVGYGSTTYGTTLPLLMYATAAQDFTDTNKGTILGFYTTPNGSTASVSRQVITHDGKFYFGNNYSGFLPNTYVFKDSTSAFNALGIQNKHAAGYSGIRFYDSGGTAKLSVGYSNSSASTAPSLSTILTQNSAPLVLGYNDVEKLRINDNINFPTGVAEHSYNTADQTTNYERITKKFTGNIAQIGTEFGGSGSIRSLRFGVSTSAGSFFNAGSRLFTINASPTSTEGIFDYMYGTGAAGNLATFNATLSGASVAQSAYSIQPTINQSGSSSYNAAQVIAFESATGSGTKNLLRLGTSTAASAGGTITDKFTVSNAGAGTFASSVTAATANITDGTNGFNIRSFSGGGGDWSIYPTAVTPSTTNYVLNHVAGSSTYLNGPSSVYLAVAGSIKLQANSTGVQVTGNLSASNTIVLPQYTVATLPATPTNGATAYVTDALAPSYMTTVVGGGAVVTPVFYNGSTWVAH